MTHWNVSSWLTNCIHLLAGLCLPLCSIRHSEIFMEGCRTWEGSGGKRKTGVLFSGRNLGCCGRGGGCSYYNCFLAITIMSPRREVGRFEDEPTRSIERSCRERKRACKSPLPLRPKAAFVIVSIERRRGRLRNAKHAPPVWGSLEM